MRPRPCLSQQLPDPRLDAPLRAEHGALQVLHRADLTAMERSELVAEWAKLAEQADAKPAQPAQVSKGGRGKKSGISQASRELGMHRDDVRRAVKVASLTPEAKEVARETGVGGG